MNRHRVNTGAPQVNAERIYRATAAHVLLLLKAILRFRMVTLRCLQILVQAVQGNRFNTGAGHVPQSRKVLLGYFTRNVTSAITRLPKRQSAHQTEQLGLVQGIIQSIVRSLLFRKQPLGHLTGGCLAPGTSSRTHVHGLDV